MSVKVGDRVQIVPQEWSGEEIEQYRGHVGVVRTVTPRPEHDKVLIGVMFNGAVNRFGFFAEEVEPVPIKYPKKIEIELCDDYGIYYAYVESKNVAAWARFKSGLTRAEFFTWLESEWPIEEQ